VVKIGYFITKFTGNKRKIRFAEMFMNIVLYASHEGFAALHSKDLEALNCQATTKVDWNHKVKHLHVTPHYAKPLL
jgi:hypothetical protein